VKLNGNRTLLGTLRGFDQFMNLVLGDASNATGSGSGSGSGSGGGSGSGSGEQLGMVVVRGDSVIMIECLERI
jgi:small nuclear ribonucleoprotein G